MNYKRKYRVDVELYDINYQLKCTSFCLGEFDKVADFAKLRDNLLNTNPMYSFLFNISEVIYDENGETKIIENH